ncbi:MAG: type I-E CRISPR-associated protein Cas5/CasD [Clostridiaceae bacterium]|nr:type I-E CRISPR-associated protein Cas5/CasD [Clostridiaceae bacterium]
MKTLLLKLAGPLQSWGTRSHFETRHTDFYPSKSAIIGMIAAGFGYHRNDDESIAALNQLDFAVRVDRQGTLLRDYHTAQKYKNNGEFDRTYVTNRYYLEDAVFVVAVGHADEKWIDRIEEALRNPYYQPFMGRRSLPLPADFILGKSTKSVVDALREFPLQDSVFRKRQKKEKTLVIYADADLMQDKVSTLRKDHVQSFSQKERKFGYRSEARMQILAKQSESSTEHDAFGAIGG